MRINIEEKWKSDPRRTALGKRIGFRSADGMLVEIIWLVIAHKGQPIPLNEFRFVENYQDWIDCGLADTEGDFVRVRGAEQYGAFFEKQRENGEKGGKHGKKGGRPKSNKTANEKPPETPNNPQETPNNPQKRPSVSVSSSSSSSYIHKAVDEKIENPPGDEDPVKNKTLVFEIRSRHCRELREIEALLAAMYPGNLVPKSVRRLIPELFLRCNQSVESVREALEDLYQHDKISTGNGLTGPRADYVTAAILNKFELRGAE